MHPYNFPVNTTCFVICYVRDECHFESYWTHLFCVKEDIVYIMFQDFMKHLSCWLLINNSN